MNSELLCIYLNKYSPVFFFYLEVWISMILHDVHYNIPILKCQNINHDFKIYIRSYDLLLRYYIFRFDSMHIPMFMSCTTHDILYIIVQVQV